MFFLLSLFMTDTFDILEFLLKLANNNEIMNDKPKLKLKPPPRL